MPHPPAEGAVLLKTLPRLPVQRAPLSRGGRAETAVEGTDRGLEGAGVTDRYPRGGADGTGGKQAQEE
jgi:hypothetical protein